MEAQIKYKFADIGHWLARCDHSTNIIELNRVEFPKLSPLYRDYVWIHECVHLLYNVYDETECNSITDQIFLQRSVSESDRANRLKFIKASNERVSHTGRSVKVDGLVFAMVFAALMMMFLKK